MNKNKAPQQETPLQKGIVTAILPAEGNVPSACIILGQQNKFTTVAGNVLPGIALTPPEAREVAYRLLLFAQLIDNGSVVPAMEQVPNIMVQ